MNRKITIALLVGILIFIGLRIPSLFEPHWYGDEGVYASVAQELENGEILYKDIWDNKPPLIYYTFVVAGNANRLFNARLFNLFAGIFSVVGILFIARKLFPRKIAIFAFGTAIFLLGTPVFEGNIANAENFFLPFTIWGMYLALIGNDNGNKYLKVLAGTLFAIAVLYKVNAFFDFAGILIFILAINFAKRKKLNMRWLWSIHNYCIGFAIPILIILFIQTTQQNLGNFIDSVFLDMFNYVEYGNSGTLGFLFLKETIFNKVFAFTIGVLLLLAHYFNKNIGKTVVFIGVIFLAEYFATLISTRHYMHYFLQAIPSLSLLTSLVVKIFVQQKTTLKKITVGVLSYLLLFLIITNFTQGSDISTNYGWEYRNERLHYKILKYYQYFFDYQIAQSLTADQYNTFFNNEETVLQNLKSHLKEYPPTMETTIYLYTDKAWAYDFLDIRCPSYFTVSYHRYIQRNGSEQILRDLHRERPALIVVDATIPTFDEFSGYLRNNYTLHRKAGQFEYHMQNDT